MIGGEKNIDPNEISSQIRLHRRGGAGQKDRRRTTRKATLIFKDIEGLREASDGSASPKAASSIPKLSRAEIQSMSLPSFDSYNPLAPLEKGYQDFMLKGKKKPGGDGYEIHPIRVEEFAGWDELGVPCYRIASYIGDIDAEGFEPEDVEVFKEIPHLGPYEDGSFGEVERRWNNLSLIVPDGLDGEKLLYSMEGGKLAETRIEDMR